MSAADNGKPGDGSGATPSNGPANSSGEGANTALEALIKKRLLRAEDDSPTAAGSADDPDLSPAQ